MTKKSLLLTLLLGLTLHLFAQGWERTYPYTVFDGAGSAVFDLAPTLDGGHLLGAEVDWPTGAIRHYIRLIKVDAGGAAQWDRTYGEGAVANSLIAGLETLPDGSAVIGVTNDFGLGATTSLLAVNAWGDTLWASGPADGFSYDLLATGDGGFLSAGRTALDFALDNPKLIRWNASGEVLWEQVYDNLNGAAFSAIEAVSTGGYIAAGTRSGLTLLMRLDEEGEVIWMQNWSLASGSRAWAVAETPDGGFVVAGSADGFAGPGPVVLKTDALGNQLWMTYLSMGIGEGVDVTVAANGDYVVTGSAAQLWQPQNGFLARLNDSGEELWLRNFSEENGFPSAGALLDGPGGGFLVAGMKGGQAWMMKTDDQGNSVTNRIEGSLWRSTTCDTDDVIGPAPNWTVRLRGAADTLYTISDTLGHYQFQVDTGTYYLQVIPPNGLWAACDGEVLLQLTEFYDTTYQNLQVASGGAFCPLLEVDVSTPFLRRCFENTYTVHYCNQGTENAFDVHVEVTLDPFLDLVAATMPYLDLGDQVFSFAIEDLAVGECGDFQVTTYLDCDNTVLGQSHCVEAHIFPDTTCLDPTGQAVIELQPDCEPDSVAFLLLNTGDADMQMPAQFIVIEDDVMYMTQPIDLGTGEEQIIRLPATGATYRLEGPHFPDDPAAGMISATVEGCDADGDGQFSTGFVNQFTLFTGNPAIDLECQPSIGSYDPNDKRAFPVGYDVEHYIEAGTSLDYHIRFQNTGTDTAFRVEIVDTLSQWLDPATFRPGPASHPYRYELLGEGIVHFIFDPVALPDSNVNEPASHGFVRFSMDTRSDAPNGALVENRAAIYFDFNAPVITNTFYHTIGEDFLRTVSVEPEPSAGPTLRIYPNPFRTEATLEIEGRPVDQGRFLLFDTRGALVRQWSWSGSRMVLSAGDLPRGLYLYRLETEGRLAGQGKLIVQ